MEQSRIDLAQTLTISEGESRKATSFAARRMTWARFVARLRTPIRTAETCAQYAAMSRAERAEIKDVGGFVGGRLEGGSRKAGSVTERQLLCLDIDYGDETIWDSWACLKFEEVDVDEPGAATGAGEADAGPGCLRGPCPEGKRSCGHPMKRGDERHGTKTEDMLKAEAAP